MVELKGSYQQYEIQWATSSYADRSIVINVFNNDLDNELSCTLSKFANQTPNWGEQTGKRTFSSVTNLETQLLRRWNLPPDAAGTVYVKKMTEEIWQKRLLTSHFLLCHQ